jgi:hypothetical protein
VRRIVGLAAAFFACLLARCLFPSLDGLSGDASVGSGPIAYVQDLADATFPPDASVTLSGAVAAGDTIIVCTAFPLDFGSLNVSDSLGRNWTLFGSQDSTKPQHNVCYVSIGGPGGIDTIALTTSSSKLADGATHDIEVYVFEYQNVHAIDQKLTMVGVIDAGSPLDSGWDAGSITATSPNELLFAWVEGVSAAYLDPSFTSRTTFDDNNVGDKMLDAAGAFTITGVANNDWALVAATFK